jgi:hypothetical protein
MVEVADWEVAGDDDIVQILALKVKIVQSKDAGNNTIEKGSLAHWSWSCQTIVSIDVDAHLCHGALVHVVLQGCMQDKLKVDEFLLQHHLEHLGHVLKLDQGSDGTLLGPTIGNQCLSLAFWTTVCVTSALL